MTIPSPSQLLDVWERGVSLSPVQRVRLLLEASGADHSMESLDRFSVGTADRQLLQLRRSLFGSRFEAVCSCPCCGEAMELGFDADQIASVEAVQDAGESHALTADGVAIRFRVPSLVDLADAGQQSDASSARSLLLERCVLQAERDGIPLEPDQLPPRVLSALSAALQRADPQAATELSLTCPACQHAWSNVFDVGAFLWSELHAWARRILREVHVLALHYGWSEPQILALPPGRRRHYLEQIAG